MKKDLKIAVVQISAGNDYRKNIERLERLIKKIPRVDLIALPEVFALRGNDDDFRRYAEPVPGPTTKWLSDIARSRKCWVLAGSIIERSGRKIFNRSVLMDRSGKIAASYRKMHLFEAYLESGQHIRESDVFTPGRSPVMADIEGWRCGFAVCYDLRFPELFRHYSRRGAHLFFLPANFTQRTGKAHWETLVRARAIENQCYVVAPNQCGTNISTHVASYGHSMVAGPWGEVLGSLKDSEGVFSVTLDKDHLGQVRKRVPVLSHTRL